MSIPGLALGTVILGAGASSRMGRPKLLLPWRGTTVIGHLISVWGSLANQVAVVIAAGENPVSKELNRLGLPPEQRIENPTPDDGMFSSIRCASRWTEWSPDLTHFAIALGDQPQISVTAIQKLIEFAKENAEVVCQPSLAGRPKHPVLLPRKLFMEIATTAGATLRDFLAIHPSRQVEIDDDSLAIDLDYPEDYARALERFTP